jgi:hypothetical protein
MALENYTTYTETDPGGNITVAANTITLAATAGSTANYVSKDAGAGHFGQFEHLVEFNAATMGTDGEFQMWGITDSPGAQTGLISGAYCSSGVGTAISIYLVQIGGGAGFDSFDTATKATAYYLKIKRTAAAINCFIYSDSGRTTLVDTLTITFDATTFRYIMAASDFNGAFTATVSSLDLQEVASTFPPVPGPVLNTSLMSLIAQ